MEQGGLPMSIGVIVGAAVLGAAIFAGLVVVAVVVLFM